MSGKSQGRKQHLPCDFLALGIRLAHCQVPSVQLNTSHTLLQLLCHVLDSLKSRPRTLHPVSASAETALPYRIVCGMPSQTTEDDITSSLTAIEDYIPSVVKVKLTQLSEMVHNYWL